MNDANYDIYNSKCPTRVILERISDKWTALIIGALAGKPYRFNELRRKVDGVSQKMLTQTLRSLEKDGFVHRSVEPTVPVSVTYSLTPLGVSLNEPIKHVREWAIKHVDDIS